MTIEIVAMGELLIDFAQVSVDENGYPLIKAQPGGAPANYLNVLSKFGMKTALISKVGADYFGQILCKTIDNLGIDTKSIIQDSDVFTTLAFITLDERGDRSFSFSRKPGADTCLRFEEIPLDIIDQCNVFHFGSLSLTNNPSRATTIALVKYARAKGKIISFDPNYRAPLWISASEAKKQMMWGIRNSDVLKISEEEAKILFDSENYQQIAKHIINEYGVKLVYITLGDKGCVFANANCVGSSLVINGIKAIDTTGAGDIFGGASMWAYLQTKKDIDDLSLVEIQKIAYFANVTAALSTTKPGGLLSVPEYSEVIDYL